MLIKIVMNPEISRRIARRRQRRFLFAGASLLLYFVYALQWIFDVRGWMEDGDVSAYFPIVLFYVLIIMMCALELMHFFLDDHHSTVLPDGTSPDGAKLGDDVQSASSPQTSPNPSSPDTTSADPVGAEQSSASSADASAEEGSTRSSADTRQNGDSNV